MQFFKRHLLFQIGTATENGLDHQNGYFDRDLMINHDKSSDFGGVYFQTKPLEYVE